MFTKDLTFSARLSLILTDFIIESPLSFGYAGIIHYALKKSKDSRLVSFNKVSLKVPLRHGGLLSRMIHVIIRPNGGLFAMLRANTIG